MPFNKNKQGRWEVKENGGKFEVWCDRRYTGLEFSMKESAQDHIALMHRVDKAGK